MFRLPLCLVFRFGLGLGIGLGLGQEFVLGVCPGLGLELRLG